jgi:hypothetical protein
LVLKVYCVGGRVGGEEPCSQSMFFNIDWPTTALLVGAMCSTAQRHVGDVSLLIFVGLYVCIGTVMPAVCCA